MLHKPKQNSDKSLAVVLHVAPSTSACNDLVVSLNQLSLHFNRYTFNTLSGVLDHLWDFLEGVKYVSLYLKIVHQALTIFGLSFAFFKGLIKVMKKNKS